MLIANPTTTDHRSSRILNSRENEERVQKMHFHGILSEQLGCLRKEKNEEGREKIDIHLPIKRGNVTIQERSLLSVR